LTYFSVGGGDAAISPVPANSGQGGPPGNPAQAGGSGVVILSLKKSNYTGTTTGSPTVSFNGPNVVLKFTGSGSYTA
jgi:hypothetical protein